MGKVHDQSGSADDIYKPNKQIRFKTSMLRSDLCDFSDAYIVVKGNIAVTEQNNAKTNKSVAFKNNAPFVNCILIDNAEDPDVVVPMYGLLEYSKNCWRTTGSLWNYCRDEPSDPLSSNSASFKYKTSIIGNTYNLRAGDDGYNPIKVIPLKHLNNFWRTLNMSLINYEIELLLNWSKNCALADMTPANNPPAGLKFQITGTKLNCHFVNKKWEKTSRACKIRI